MFYFCLCLIFVSFSFLLFPFLYVQHQDSALHISAWHGYSKILLSLCKAGAYVHLRNEVNIFFIVSNRDSTYWSAQKYNVVKRAVAEQSWLMHLLLILKLWVQISVYTKPFWILFVLCSKSNFGGANQSFQRQSIKRFHSR